MPLIALAILIVLVVVALIPISIVQRFRVGIRQRQARGWLAALNVLAVSLSVVLVVLGAWMTSRWVPEALTYTLGGLAVGGALGLLGIAMTRWEHVDRRLFYTPNRWLVTAVTLVVSARVLYGFWRMWETWRASIDAMTWVAASGLAASMSAGAVVLGYYTVYWAGVWAQIRWREQR